MIESHSQAVKYRTIVLACDDLQMRLDDVPRIIFSDLTKLSHSSRRHNTKHVDYVKSMTKALAWNLELVHGCCTLAAYCSVGIGCMQRTGDSTLLIKILYNSFRMNSPSFGMKRALFLVFTLGTEYFRIIYEAN